jgi:hypothetical protein
MSGKRKAVDGFVPSKKNAGSYFKKPAPGKGHTGIATRELLKGLKPEEVFEHKVERPDKILDLSGIVPLRARNGNNLKIEVSEDVPSHRWTPPARVPEKPKHLWTPPVDDWAEERKKIEPEKENNPNRWEVGTAEKSGSAERRTNRDDSDGFDSENERDEALEFLNEDDGEPSRTMKHNVSYNRRPNNIFEPANNRAAEANGRTDEADADELSASHFRSRREKLTGINEKDPRLDDIDDDDNDLGVDDDDIKTYRSRRETRISRLLRRGSEKHLLVRTLVIIAVLVVTIIVSYFLFSMFYKAPTPATVSNSSSPSNGSAGVVSIGGTDSSKKSANSSTGSKTDSSAVTEAPANVIVYNAGTTVGAAAKATTDLTAKGMTATNGGNLTNAGTGYVIYDLTGGKKPKAAATLKELYGVAPTSVTASSLPAGVDATKDFVVIIH